MKLSRYKFFQSNFFECLLHLAFIIGTVVILFGFGYLTMQGVSDINWYDSAFLRFACILTIVGVVYTVQEWMWNVYRADEHTKWWNIGAKPDQPDWEDVRKMTMGAFEDDPIDYGQKKRLTCNPIATISLLAGYLALGSFAIVCLTIIAKNQLPSLFLTSAAEIPAKAGAVVNLSGNLTAFLGFIAAGFTVFFTYRQFQAKVKADSRQAWINSLRARIAEVVSLADAIHNTRAVSLGVDSAYSQLSNARLELELMLNPSEKDHRLLMCLTMKMAFFVANFGPSDFNLIHDVRNIEASITADVHHAESKKLWKDILKFPKNEKDYSNLIDYIMRLSHVVLKREWERVKATR